jgi:hypothetical protein
MLDTLDHVPRVAFAHVGRQPSRPALELTTLRALYRRRKRLFDHQAWASSYAGLHWPEPDDVAAVTESLASDSAATLDRHRIARAAREALATRECLIPGGRDVNDCARRAVLWIEFADCKRLDAAVPACIRERWLPVLLSEVGAGSMTVLEWLRRPPRRRSTETLREELRKLQLTIELMPRSDRVGNPPERLRA